MPRTKRTTKQLAQRMDLNYFKRPTRLRRMRFLLSLGAPLVALLWLGGYGLARNSKPYSSGGMSAGHAVLTEKCGSCHASAAHGFSAKTSDRACLACHDGPIHHADEVFAPACSSCHVEHRGRLRLAATADESCTQCHSDLRTTAGRAAFVRDISGFDTGHPEFAALRAGFTDPGTIKLNHAIHLKAGLLGPNGPVQLDCGDCHRSNPEDQDWRFSAAGGEGAAAASATGGAQAVYRAATEIFGPPSRSYARAYMLPVTYARNCAGCHTLQFDKRFSEGVPHDTPAVVHAFVVKKFQEYIAAHPGELRETGSTVALPAEPLPVSPRVYTPQQWVAARVGEAEQLLWGKTCKQCHALSVTAGAELPVVAKSNITARWFPHAVFDHEQHRLASCESCHPKARSSQETADVLVPGVATCRGCHHGGAEGAENRCFECHTYHDWSKERELRARLASL